MRIAILALTAAAVLTAAESREVKKTVPLAINGTLTVENHKGVINITTWDRAEVDVQARIEMDEDYGSSSRRRFEETEVVVEGSGSSASIRTKFPESFGLTFNEGNNPLIRYTIRMPRTARLTIRDHRSEIEINDLNASLDLRTHRGTVRVHRFSGPLEVNTHRGEIHVDFAAFTGNSSIETHRGTIDLGLPRNSRLDVRSRSDRHASIESDFALSARGSRKHAADVSASVNGGGPLLDIRTYRGEIRLRAL